MNWSPYRPHSEMSQQFPLSADNEKPINSHLSHNNSYCLFYYYSKMYQSLLTLNKCRWMVLFEQIPSIFSQIILYYLYIQCSHNPLGFRCDFSPCSPTTFPAHIFDGTLRKGIFFFPFTCYVKCPRSSLPWTETWINDDIQHLWNLSYPRLPGFYFHAGRQRVNIRMIKLRKRGTKRCQQRTSNTAEVGGKQWRTSLARQEFN